VNILREGKVLVPNFQQRVLIGTATFVGILLLVFWIAVNEPARMDVFTQQYLGRSIENGALTFANNCATCHGPDGKGLEGKAPALNNPMLFLRDNPALIANSKVTDLTKQQSSLKAQIDDYNKSIQTINDLNAKLKTATPGSDDEKKLKDQLDQENNKIKNFDLARTQKQVDDMTTQIQQAQADLKALTDQGWDPTRDTRLHEVKWNGRLQDYIISTVISGRPVSAIYWAPSDPMPAWGQQAGGPMRMDEIIDVSNYIMNFQDTAVKLTPKDVRQQFKQPGSAPAVKVNESGKAVGSGADIKALVKEGLTGGDPVLGEQKYVGLACAGCHKPPAVTGPPTPGTYTRIINERLKDPANAGKTPEEYIAESIIHPSAYVVPPFTDGVMPKTFGDQLDIKDIKDLIAYLETQK
jgi:mono/diheme cytochrome c family protein